MSAYTRLLRLTTCTALVVLAFVVLAPAQLPQSTQTARDARRVDLIMRQKELRELDKVMEREPVKAPETRTIYRDLSEDFKQLQLVNYSLASVANPQATLDYTRVRKESAEVRKRAARLKIYLLLPTVETKGTQEKAAEIQTPEALRAAVGRLNTLVNSFAWNPIFRQPDVVNLEHSTKASHDLVGIINLSERIRKGADELGKSLAKK